MKYLLLGWCLVLSMGILNVQSVVVRIKTADVGGNRLFDIFVSIERQITLRSGVFGIMVFTGMQQGAVPTR